MFYFYVLQSLKTGKLYFGYSSNLKKRVEYNNKGLVKFTSRFKPWKLIYYEAYDTEEKAREREKQIKHHGKAYSQLKKRIL